MSIGLSVLSFIACAPAPEGAAGAILNGDAFELTIRPSYLESQADMIDEITDLEVLIHQSDGTSVRESLLTLGSSEYTHDNFPPLDNVTLTLVGSNDGGVVFHGTSRPVTVNEGDHTVIIFVGRNGQSEPMPHPLPEPNAMGTLVPVGDGKFFGFGGTSQGLYSNSSTQESFAYDLHQMAAGEPTSRRLESPFPASSEGLGRIGHTATLLSGTSAYAGQILLVGGADRFLDEDGRLSSQAVLSTQTVLFDPSTETFASTQSLTHPRMGHTATAFENGNVVVAGGFAQPDTDTSIVPYVEIYDPTEERWTVPQEGFQVGGIFHAAAPLGDRGVLICGGIHPTLSVSDQCHLVTPTGAIQTAPALPKPLLHASMTPLNDGTILLTGGLSPETAAISSDLLMDMEATRSAWLYKDDEWRSLPSMSLARANHNTAVLPGGRVVIAGGVTKVDMGSDRGLTPYSGLLFDSTDAIACVEVYDPESKSFQKWDSCTVDSQSSTLSQPTALPQMATDPFFGTLIAGGITSDGAHPTDEVVLFYPHFDDLY